MTLAPYLLNSLWQLPVLMLATWLLVRLCGASDARLRYHLWITCLVLAVVLPAIPHPSVHFASVPAELRSTSPMSLQPNASSKITTPNSPGNLHRAVELAFLIYCGIIVWGCFRLLWDGRCIRRILKKSSLVCLSPSLASKYEAALQRLTVTAPTIRSHEQIGSPAVAGWTRPVILVPSSFSTWSTEDASAALCHELTHIARRDFAANVACRILMLPLLYHPLSFCLRRQIELAREIVCDGWAAELSVGRHGYAHCLLSMSRKSFQTQQGLTVGWHTTHPLEERIMQLIHSQSSKPHNRWTSVVTVTVLGGFALSLTLASAVSARAQSSKASATVSPASPTTPAQSDTNSEPLAIAKGDHAHVSKQPGTYEHHWTAADGQTVVIVTKSPEPPSAQERLRIEKTVRDAKLSLGDLPKLLASVESSLDSVHLDDVQDKVDKAELTLNDPAFQKEMSAMEERIKKSEQALREAEKALSHQ